MSTPNILKGPDGYIVQYPAAVKFCEQQEDIFWTAKEISLEKDLLDLKTKLTEAELHGVTTILKLFTEYELRVGTDYWLGKVLKTFKRPEIRRMASVFGQMELNVHGPFYSKINEILGLNTPEFYNEYIKDETLSARMDHIDEAVRGGEYDTWILRDLYSLCCFSIVEGAILYSNFAFLKHFQAQGKNCLTNLVAGIDMSLRDERVHAEGGAWLARTLMKEMREAGRLDELEAHHIDLSIEGFCNQVREHEHRIIDMIFEKGRVVGITDHQMKCFVDSRLNLCREQLGLTPLYEVKYNPIADWFYKSVQQGRLHDFFAMQGSQYNRDWKEDNFVW